MYRKRAKLSVESLCETAQQKGLNAAFFHADMTAKERAKIVDKIKTGETRIVFATNAFGMGIDIPDIRVVVHFMIPESVEQYYQEIGRAARDGQGANAYLLFTNKNIEIKRKYFIDGSFPFEEKLGETYPKLVRTNKGYGSLDVFEDEDILKCLFYTDST